MTSITMYRQNQHELWLKIVEVSSTEIMRVMFTLTDLTKIDHDDPGRRAYDRDGDSWYHIVHITLDDDTSPHDMIMLVGKILAETHQEAPTGLVPGQEPLFDSKPAAHLHWRSWG